VNPPYGLRIGDRKKLYPLYGALGTVLRARFAGWRVGVVTADPALARATGPDFHKPRESVDNNGTRIALYRTGTLAGASPLRSGLHLMWGTPSSGRRSRARPCARQAAA